MQIAAVLPEQPGRGVQPKCYKSRNIVEQNRAMQQMMCDGVSAFPPKTSRASAAAGIRLRRGRISQMPGNPGERAH